MVFQRLRPQTTGMAERNQGTLLLVWMRWYFLVWTRNPELLAVGLLIRQRISMDDQDLWLLTRALLLMHNCRWGLQKTGKVLGEIVSPWLFWVRPLLWLPLLYQFLVKFHWMTSCIPAMISFQDQIGIFSSLTSFHDTCIQQRLLPVVWSFLGGLLSLLLDRLHKWWY